MKSQMRLTWTDLHPEVIWQGTDSPVSVYFELYREYYRKALGVANDDEILIVEIDKPIWYALNPVEDEEFPGQVVRYNVERGEVQRVPSDRVGGSVHVVGEDKIRIVRWGHGNLGVIAKKDLEALEKMVFAVSITPEVYDEPSFGDMFWTEPTILLQKDVKFFTESFEWFKAKGLPYRRSYLLYGAPGNGKTLSIRVVAKYLKVEPECFDFSASYDEPDTGFMKWVTGAGKLMEKAVPTPEYQTAVSKGVDGQRPYIRLLALEDLDKYYPSGGEPKSKVSLTAVLNGLDGIVQATNTILFATANHPENLDQTVLSRPGRFHRRISFAPPNADEAERFMKWRFEGEKISEGTIKEVVKQTDGHSFALLSELLTCSAAIAFERGSKELSDEDVMTALSQQLQAANVLKGAAKPGF